MAFQPTKHALSDAVGKQKFTDLRAQILRIDGIWTENKYGSKHKTQSEQNLLGREIFGSSYGAISGFADKLREWLNNDVFSVLFAAFDDFARDFAFVVLLVEAVDGVGGDEDGGMARPSFVDTWETSFERRFDWDSIGWSRSNRLFEWKPFMVTLERSDGVERMEDGGGIEGK